MVIENKVPIPAAWLGGLGAIPFVILSSATPCLEKGNQVSVINALSTYGAIILSFLGGIHWGMAIISKSESGNSKLRKTLIVSVLPPLAAWSSLFLTDRKSLIMLAGAMALMLWFDLRISRAGQAPPWYPTLRIPLSCVVIASLIFGASA